MNTQERVDATLKTALLKRIRRAPLTAKEKRILKAYDAFDVESFCRELGLLQENDESVIGRWVDRAIEANPGALDDVQRAGDRAVGSLVGQVMKLSDGRANPVITKRIINERAI